MRLGLHLTLAYAAPWWLLLASAGGAEPLLIFGLTNVPLGDAVFTRATVGLQVNLNGTNTEAAAWPLPPAGSAPLFNGISTNEISTNGLSVFLGEADSGFFFYPRKDDAALDNGWFLLGRAYGRVNGSNDQLICTLSGIRNDWGLYGVGVDFTPLGATSQTWQVYCEHTLIAQATNRGTTANWRGAKENLYFVDKLKIKRGFRYGPDPIPNPLQRFACWLRSKLQGPKSKVQSPKSKVQSRRAKVQDREWERFMVWVRVISSPPQD